MKPMINSLARQLIERALEQGETLESIAGLCGVSLGSVKRWLATGRADKKRIAPLAAKIGPVYTSPAAVAQELIAIKRQFHLRTPIRIKRSFVKKVAGRSRLKGSFETDLIDALDDQGYLLIEAVDEESDVDVFLMFTRRWLMKKVAVSLKKADIETWFADRVPADNETEDEAITGDED